MSPPRASGHVAIVSSNFWPEQTGIAQTVTEFARFLANRGIIVRVATSMPYYPQWRIWSSYRGHIWRRDCTDRLVIFRSWYFVRPAVSTLTRLLHELTLSIFSIPSHFTGLVESPRSLCGQPSVELCLLGECHGDPARCATCVDRQGCHARCGD